MLHTNDKPSRGTDSDIQKGAVEGDRPEDEQQGNDNAPALDSEGLPSDHVAIAQDRIGANTDDSEVSNANETGATSDAERRETTDSNSDT